MCTHNRCGPMPGRCCRRIPHVMRRNVGPRAGADSHNRATPRMPWLVIFHTGMPAALAAAAAGGRVAVVLWWCARRGGEVGTSMSVPPPCAT